MCYIYVLYTKICCCVIPSAMWGGGVGGEAVDEHFGWESIRG